jgi:hypothetical protein
LDFLCEIERDYFEDLCIDGRIILKWIVKKKDGKAKTGLLWFSMGTVTGTCKCGDELSDFTECKKFLD